MGVKIKALRKQQGISQAKLAEMIDRSTESVSNLERNISLPSISTLLNIGEQLDIPISYFFEDNFKENSGGNRAAKIAELHTIAYSLSERDLELAVDQMRAFKKHQDG